MKIHLIFAFILFSLNISGQNVDRSFKPFFTGVINSAVKLAIQQNGDIICGGSIQSVGTEQIFGFVRLKPSGSIDSTFNSDLRLQGRLNDILAQDDGKIMIVGQDLSDHGDIIRLDEHGQFDSTFIIDPVVKTAGAVKIRKQDDGKYIIAAFQYGNIFRLNEDGSLDSSFDAGTGLNSIGISNFDIEILQDGKILLVGNFTTYNEEDVKKIVRINSNGLLDETFDIGAGPGHSSGYPVLMNAAIQSDGKIILAGTFDSFDNVAVEGLVRLNLDGSVDDTFLVPGPAANAFSSGSKTLGVLPSNQIIVGGLSYQQGLFYKIILLKPDGSLETTFTTSEFSIPLTVGQIISPALAISPSNEIFTAGAIESVNGKSRIGIAASDTLGNILAFNPTLGGQAEISDIAVQEDEKVVVGGEFLAVNGYPVNNLIRLLSDGSVDSVFANNIGIGTNRGVNSIKIQSDGNILVAGAFDKFNGEQKTYLVRLGEDGSVDQSFSPIISLQSVNEGIVELHEQSDGKIIIAGSIAYIDGSPKNNFGRLNDDGTLDNTFNTSNFLVPNDRVISMSLQSDGKIIIGGDNHLDGTGGFIFRTDSDGQLDDSFLHNLDLSNTSITQIEVLPNDDLLVGTNFSTSFPQNQSVPVYILSKDGAVLDALSISVLHGTLTDILSLGTDDFLFVGNFDNVNSIERIGLCRLKLSGEILSFDPKIELSGVSEFRTSVNRIIKIDDETVIVAGVFNQVGSKPGFSGIAKISLSNDIPIITGTSNEYVTDEDTPVEISLQNLAILDDGYFPEDYTLTVQEGENYTVSGTTVTPVLDFWGSITVPVSVNDGWDQSPFFDIPIEVSPINDPPVIIGALFEVALAEATPFDISLVDLEVIDPDNTYPEDFSLIISEGEEYSVDNFTITPTSGFLGSFEIPIAVSDGIDSSEFYMFNVTINEILGLTSRLTLPTVYPNPTSGEINIELREKKHKLTNWVVSIFDLTGRVILSKNVEAAEVIQLNIESLSNGIYVMKIQDEKNHWISKIRKN